jgi:hypothetical protein
MLLPLRSRSKVIDNYEIYSERDKQKYPVTVRMNDEPGEERNSPRKVTFSAGLQKSTTQVIRVQHSDLGMIPALLLAQLDDADAQPWERFIVIETTRYDPHRSDPGEYACRHVSLSLSCVERAGEGENSLERMSVAFTTERWNRLKVLVDAIDTLGLAMDRLAEMTKAGKEIDVCAANSPEWVLAQVFRICGEQSDKTRKEPNERKPRRKTRRKAQARKG